MQCLIFQQKSGSVCL